MTTSEHGAGASTYVCCGQKYPFTLPTAARPAMTSEVAAMAAMSQPIKPSPRFAIGDAVLFDLGTGRPGIPAFVRSITISTGKVRYAIWVPEASTTLQNIDSSFIHPNPGQPSKDFSGEDQ